MAEVTCPICAKVFVEKDKNKIGAWRNGGTITCSEPCRREKARLKSTESSKKRRERMGCTPKPKKVPSTVAPARLFIQKKASWIPYSGVGASDFPALHNPF